VTITLALLLAYSALMVGVGLWLGRRVRGGADFFVAGRGLSANMIAATFLAANIGASSTVNATALGYREGLSAWWWNGAAGIGSLVLAFTVGPRIWREASAFGDFTVGDFLQRHYGGAMRGLVAALIWIGTLSILAAQLIGVGAVLEVAGGVPFGAGVVIGALVALAYFVAGGLLSSVWVNLIQLVVIVAGFTIAAVLGVSVAGGWEAITVRGGSSTDIFAAEGPRSGWHLLFLLGPAFVVSPGLLQKAFGARDGSAARRGIALNALVLMLFACAPAVIGLTAAAMYPGLERADLALPTMLAEGLPASFGALALAGVFAAEISSADAVLFMLSTSASRDLYRGLLRPAASDASVVRVARAAAVAGAAAGVALSFVHRSVLDAAGAFYSVLVVTLFVPIIGGVYVRQLGPAQGLASLAGIPVLAYVHLTTGGLGYGLVSPTIAGVLASAAATLMSVAAARR
jgi:SSS family solute:Na+ symporter